MQSNMQADAADDIAEQLYDACSTNCPINPPDPRIKSDATVSTAPPPPEPRDTLQDEGLNCFKHSGISYTPRGLHGALATQHKTDRARGTSTCMRYRCLYTSMLHAKRKT